MASSRLTLLILIDAQHRCSLAGVNYPGRRASLIVANHCSRCRGVGVGPHAVTALASQTPARK